MLALKSVLPFLPMIAALSANHLAAVDLSPALSAGSMSRATTTRPAAGRRSSCTNEEKPPGSMSATSCRSTPTSTPISAASAPWPCSRTSFLSSPLTTSPVSPAPRICTDWREFAAGSRPGMRSSCRRSCRRVPWPAEKGPRPGLPERRSAGAATGSQWRAPTIFRRRASPALQREAKCSAPATLRCAAALRVRPRSVPGLWIAVKAATGAADPPAERHPP